MHDIIDMLESYDISTVNNSGLISPVMGGDINPMLF